MDGDWKGFETFHFYFKKSPAPPEHALSRLMDVKILLKRTQAEMLNTSLAPEEKQTDYNPSEETSLLRV